LILQQQQQQKEPNLECAKKCKLKCSTHKKVRNVALIEK